jgi:hypothetical protein
LALALGKSVRWLRQNMDARELAEWMAYDRLSPIDPQWRADLRMALLRSTLLAANGVKAKPEDLMPQFGTPER